MGKSRNYIPLNKPGACFANGIMVGDGFVCGGGGVGCCGRESSGVLLDERNILIELENVRRWKVLCCLLSYHANGLKSL